MHPEPMPSAGGSLLLRRRLLLGPHAQRLRGPWRDLAGGGDFLRRESLNGVQRYFTDGYYHTHYTPRELRSLLDRHSLASDAISITHMTKRYVPLVPARVDRFWLQDRPLQRPATYA